MTMIRIDQQIAHSFNKFIKPTSITATNDDDEQHLHEEHMTKSHPFDLSFARVLAQQLFHRKQQELKVITSAAFAPKKVNKARVGIRLDCGEDAFFVSHHFPATSKEEKRVCAIGVADGVGGYALRGFDPALMAWSLMDGCKAILDRDHNTSCLQALTECYDEIIEHKLVDVGGSTACVVSLHSGKDDLGMPVLKLSAANLGDSSFMVIRNGMIVFRSFEQTHYFNCPYQLTVPRVENNPLQDDPSKSEIVNNLHLIRGDVLILATDGLTDNIFDEEIVRISSLRNGSNAEAVSASIAKELLTVAYRRARSKNCETPFMDYAAKHGHVFVGGKLDDITVVVALIV